MYDHSITRSLALSTGSYDILRRLKRRFLRRDEVEALNNDVRFYSQLLPSEPLCFDVGANIGVKAEAMLEAGAEVVAIEPQLDLIPRLEARCSSLGKMSVIAAGAADEPGIRLLRKHESQGRTSFRGDWPGTTVETREAAVITLDMVIEFHGVPDYIKIDVEGYEYEVVSGLSSVPNVLSIEFHEDRVEEVKTGECLRRLNRLGYKKANVTGANSLKFLYDKWIDIEKLGQMLPDLLPESETHRRGDIFVTHSDTVIERTDRSNRP